MSILVAFDVETTGTNPVDHRVIEYAGILYDLDKREKLDQFVCRFNPERSIEPGAQRVHHISYADVAASPKFAEKANEISLFMARADFQVGHNVQFDDSMVRAEFRRAGVSFKPLPMVCTMEQARWATPDGKSPSLKELCFALRAPYDKSKAHAALYDVEAMLECFLRGYDKGFYKIPNL